ncbi:uncharacterized protein LOC126832938 [Adelges cooleyi]|uniref:uncharacterized protein LOC126832938 n=1 Tax=Adelges cooleyi TaxID=133065 RepID=UPI0021801F1D|nr:uncharacterized protein LOC126832938 [Adelges cooleyi]XP_050419953.1 uncharacterized protein LOC126832938 [Adelges cooleyi]
MAKSRNGLTAVGLSVLGTFFVLLAFCTKNWLVTDGKLEHPKFERIGLWVVCFKDFEDSHHWYDTKFGNCWWVFEEEYYIIYDVLFKGFYIAVQFWFSVCVLLTICGLFYTTLYMYLNRSVERYVHILFTAGGIYLAAAITSTIALILFGINGDSRVWMPNWEHNDVGWSYGVAVAGTISLYVSGILYIIEGRVHKIKREKMASQRAHYDYDIEDHKQSSHTDI